MTMAVDLMPIRHRRETVREQNLRLELAEQRRDAIALCDEIEPRLNQLYVATIAIGPAAEQLCIKALYEIKRYRTRNER
jgi:hypothetical protein